VHAHVSWNQNSKSICCTSAVHFPYAAEACPCLAARLMARGNTSAKTFSEVAEEKALI